jgi:hypothetical protein
MLFGTVALYTDEHVMICKDCGLQGAHLCPGKPSDQLAALIAEFNKRLTELEAQVEELLRERAVS